MALVSIAYPDGSEKEAKQPKIKKEVDVIENLMQLSRGNSIKRDSDGMVFGILDF
jgi:hypothetical protein